MFAPDPKQAEVASPGETVPSQKVVRLPAADSDAAIVKAIRARHATGSEALFDRYHGHVRRVLVHVLGPDRELSDLVQDVFVTAIDSIERLDRVEALRGWLGSIAVFTARSRLRSRRRRKILRFLPTEELPEVPVERNPVEIDEAARAVYRVLELMPVEERIVFALRFVDAMELTEVASACVMSLSTVKRRLKKASARFQKLASREPALLDWLGGSQWAR